MLLVEAPSLQYIADRLFGHMQKNMFAEYVHDLVARSCLTNKQRHHICTDCIVAENLKDADEAAMDLFENHKNDIVVNHFNSSSASVTD